MKKICKLLCAVLALLTALLAAGCSSGVIDESVYSRFMSEVRSELLDAFENNGNSSPQDTPGYSSYENSSSSDSGSENSGMGGDVSAPIDENGSFTTKDDVALYINTYGKLPKNFMTKEEARVLGWVSGSLEPYAPGMCIGGDYFGNYEERLPKKDGRSYTECDIDTLGASSRGAKRIVFSNDGLIYYTDDHYESFTLLYGEE